MTNRDLRIAKITRNLISYDKPVFQTDAGPGSFYQEAASLSFRYNQEMKKRGGDFTAVSAGKLNAGATLHYVYQIILTYLLGDENRDFFRRRIQTVESNTELREALEFYAGEFPTEIEDDRTVEEDMRGYFIHQVILQNRALVSAARPFVAPENLTLPSSFRALSSVLSSFEKDDLRNGEPNTEDVFTFLCMPARLYPDSLIDQLQYILREWSDMLPESFVRMLKSSIDYINEEQKDRGGPGPGGPVNVPVMDYSSELNEYEAFSSDSNWMPCVVMIADRKSVV